jgi:predicted short-subunit dehydrogenase-like oxidoreductase (DUF2520 family)
MEKSPKIAIIGAGRVAWHLGRRLKGKGIPVAQVISRTESRTRDLATSTGAAWSISLADIDPQTDWILLAVKDDAIAEVASQLGAFAPESLVTHTSGGTSSSVLAPFFHRRGVFYPLQSFSFEHTPVWSRIPFCVDATSAEDLLFLKKTAKRIGNLVYHVNDEQRARLHVAAVFANNFTNHCFAIAEKILDDQELPFEMLHPLMEETVAKALHESPARMQTGPAARGDVETMRRHLKLLDEYPDLQKMYKLFSSNISGMEDW